MNSAGYIDLHVHLRGTLSESVARDMARKKGKPHNYINSDNGTWHSFETFLEAYHDNGKVVSSEEDLEFLAYSYLKRSANSGSRYVEFMHSPDHSFELGVSYDDQVSAISNAMERAETEFGIYSGLILTCVRHMGSTPANRLADWVLCSNYDRIVGFGLTGNEHLNHPKDFQRAFTIAREKGLGLTAHAGEWMNSTSVLETVDLLGLDRIGHGISAANDDDVLRELIERSVGFEICISSNVALKAVASIHEHPLSKIISAGGKVALCTDDPEYFNTTSEKEYIRAQQELFLSDEQLRQISLDSIELAFCDSDTKLKLVQYSQSK